MDLGGERRVDEVWDLGPAGRVSLVATWTCEDGTELRVVRWQLRDAARALYQWARGEPAGAPAAEEGAEVAEPWSAGVALERRESATARWSSLRRQEVSGRDPAEFAARLRGWEAGLIDRAEKLGRRPKRL